MPSRRALLPIALPLALLAATPAAALERSDPAATLRALYALSESENSTRLQSARLKRLFAAQEARGRRLGRLMPGLDTVFACDCSDPNSANLQRSLRLAERRRTATMAEVAATVDNGAGPMVLAYRLVREGGRWLIDDVTREGTNGWTLSALLRSTD